MAALCSEPGGGETLTAGADSGQSREEAALSPAVRIKEEPPEESDYLTVRVQRPGDDEETEHSSEGSAGEEDAPHGDWLFRSEDGSETVENRDDPQDENTHDGPIVCLDTDSQWDNLLVSTDTDRRMLCCAICGREFSSSRGFFNHQLKHRNEDVRPEPVPSNLIKQKLYECKECGKTYTTIGQCLNHQRSHKQASKSVFHELADLKKKAFQCPTCGRSYSRASALDAHRHCHEIKLVKSKNTESEKNPVPEVIVKNEDTTSNPVSEIPETPQNKAFECSCGRSFRTTGGLSTHQRFSANCSNAPPKAKVKPSFDCSECGKSFDSPLAVACHQRWHKRRAVSDGMKDFKCEECGKSFTSLTFYNKHQRLAHTQEIAAKSFLNQVHHLQKKAFECQECGRRFSRVSALHSHQLCHTDVFSDILDGGSKAGVKSLQQGPEKLSGFPLEQQEHLFGAPLQTDLDKDGFAKEFKLVRVNTANGHHGDGVSRSEQNPDLELLCESDQEDRCLKVMPAASASPDLDVNIVQVDDSDFKEGSGIEGDQTVDTKDKKYKCTLCNRTFDKAVALHCHIWWHKGRNGKKCRYSKTINAFKPGLKKTVNISDHESFSKADHYYHLEKHKDHKPSIGHSLATPEKNSLECELCGLQFSRISALHAHMSHHETYQSTKCSNTYLNDVNSSLHSDEKMEQFNPRKTLLGPKVHHCKKCGKGFWSMGAFFHHKQYHPQCSDMGFPQHDDGLEMQIREGPKKKTGRRRGRYNISSRTLLQCEVCDKSYRVLACFLKHKRSHGIDQTGKSSRSQLEQSKENLQLSTNQAAEPLNSQLEQLNNFYSCPYCGKLFSRAMALQFHMQSHGYETGLPVGGAVLPQCKNCLAFFNSQSTLEAHQQLCRKSEQKTSEGLDVENPNKTQEKVPAQEGKAVPENQPKEPDTKAVKFHKQNHPQEVSIPKSDDLHSVKPDQPGKTVFYRPTCGKRFSTNNALRTHKRWHRDKKVARFSRKSRLMYRKSSNHGPFLCNLCGKGFFYLCVLWRHQRNHPPLEGHSQTNFEPPTKTLKVASLKSGLALAGDADSLVPSSHSEPLEIKEALGVSSTVTDLPQTSGEILPTSKARLRFRHQCLQCHKSFPNNRGLLAHKWQKHKRPRGRPSGSGNMDLKPFPCYRCNKRYGSQASLQNHRRVCNGDRAVPKPKEPSPSTRSLDSTSVFLHKCSICGKAFANEQQLGSHKEASRSRPFSCALCCRGFWTESQLHQHLIWHDEMRSRLPTELRYRLSSATGGDQGLRVSSSPQTSPPFFAIRPQDPLGWSRSEHLYQCDLCSKMFSDIRYLLAHHQKCSSGKEPSKTNADALMCIECGISFCKEEDLHQHYIDHARGKF